MMENALFGGCANIPCNRHREREQHFKFSDILELVFLEMTKLTKKAASRGTPVWRTVEAALFFCLCFFVKAVV